MQEWLPTALPVRPNLTEETRTLRDKEMHERWKDALLAFITENSHAAVDPFRESMANWGHERIAADGVVSDDMVRRHGFVEIIGQQGTCARI